MPDSPPAQDETQRALELAYRAVSQRDRTVAELRTYLERKRVGPQGMAAAVEELSDAGYLDDARYAERFAEDKRGIERWGSERIARDLRRRGIEPELIERTLAATERDDELRRALELLTDRGTLPPTDDRSRDQAWRLLVRRGYTSEVAYDAVRAYGRADAA